LPLQPFCGIRPFGYADHRIFFARAERTRHLNRLVTINRGVLLYGDSGAGKSSLVNAGLLPASVEDGTYCERLRIQPTPNEEIVLERVEAGGEKLLDSALAPRDESAPQVVFCVEEFERQVRAACERRELLLVFDHFEDVVVLFDEVDGEDARQRIINMPVGFLCEESLKVKLLFVFREDYLGWIADLLSSCPERFLGSLRLHAPKANELKQIIRGPFEQYPGHYDPEIAPNLAQQLLVMLAERFGAGDVSLSEVQTVCLRLWQSETPESLLEARGLQGILEDYLNEELDALTPEMREAAVALLSEMVTAAGTRNVISGEDLSRGMSERLGIPSTLITETLARLDQRSRLVHCERRRELRLYEIASEFLVPWITERREQLQRQRERRRDLRRRRLLWRIAAGATLLSALLAVLTVWALSQRSAARRAAIASHREAVVAASLALLSVSQEQLEDRPDVSLLLALAAYQMHPSGEARNILISALEEARTAGLSGILHGEATTTASVDFSRDGETLASGANDGVVRLWNVRSRRQLAQLFAGASRVNTVAFGPDGQSFATGDEDGTIKLWSSRTFKQLGYPIETHDRVLESIAFSPDAQMLAAGGLNGRLSIWSVVGHKEVGAPISAHDPVGSVAFSPNGRILAAGDYHRTVRLWSVRTHRQLGSPLETFANQVTEVAFSADGRTLAALTTELFGQGRIQLWDVATHTQRGNSIGRGREIGGFAFSRDGRTLAAGGNGGTTLWSVATQREIRQPLTSPGHVAAVAFSPDGEMLASAEEDDLVALSPVVPMPRLEVFGDHRSGRAGPKLLAFGNHGRTLISAGEDGSVRHWDIDAHAQLGSTLDTFPARARCRVLSPNGDALASEDEAGTIWLWNLLDGRLLGRLPSSQDLASTPSEAELNGDCAERLSFSPDGRTLAMIAGESAEKLQLWNVATGSLSGQLSVTGESLSKVVFGPDDRTLVSVSVSEGSYQHRNRVQLWDATSQTRLGRAFTIDHDIGQMIISRDRRTLAFVSIASGAGEVGKVLLWDITTHKQAGQLPLGHGESVGSIALSRDGLTLVSVSGEDGGSEEVGGEVRLWDLATRRQLGSQLTEGGGSIQSIVFSPIGNALAFLGGGGRIELWKGILWADLPELHDEVCGLVGGGLTRTEWIDYAPGIPYSAVC
jgi:WD40 repeat protein/energy-coupling factor transporter ATP-binding protein EcfA2